MQSVTSKTKKILIDAARELFALRGKANTTMNDIAEASNKGRRTLYTYFRNKDDVYRAVVENEVNLVLEVLRENSKDDLTPYNKLKNHIIIHLDSIKKSVTRNGSLRADFFKDIYEVERTRLRMDSIELKIIRDILESGIEAGEFKRVNVETFATIILYSLKGLEVPYIRERIGSEFDEDKKSVIELIFRGIKRT